MRSKSRLLAKHTSGESPTTPPNSRNGNAVGPSESPATRKRTRKRTTSGNAKDTVILQNGDAPKPSPTARARAQKTLNPRRAKDKGTDNLQNGEVAEPSAAQPKSTIPVHWAIKRRSPGPECSQLPPALSLKDLECIRKLGSGSYGTVLLVRVRPRENPHPLERPGSLFAIKVYEKREVIRVDKKRPEDTDMERKTLHKLPWSTWINAAIDAFHDSVNLYLLLECIPGGLFHDLIYERGPLEAGIARFYYTNIACALEFLHINKIVHLDLKPANILIKSDGYLCVVDFGLSKPHESCATWSVIGTPVYMAPELLGYLRRHDGYGVDWWSSGIILYEMLTQQVPYPGKTEMEVYQRLVRKEYKWPPNMRIGKVLESFVSGLLQHEAEKRLGGKSPVSEHPWLADIDWDKVISHNYVAPGIPGNVDLTRRRLDKPLPLQASIPDLRIATLPEHLKYNSRLYPRRKNANVRPARAPQDEM